MIHIPPSIWRVPGVDKQPVMTLEAWRVMRVPAPSKPSGTAVYLVGRNVLENEGRVSSAVLHIDRATLHARTASGRLYELSGHPGFDGDGMYVWHSKLNASSIKLVDVTDITNDPAAWPQADGEPRS